MRVSGPIDSATVSGDWCRLGACTNTFAPYPGQWNDLPTLAVPWRRGAQPSEPLNWQRLHQGDLLAVCRCDGSRDRTESLLQFGFGYPSAAKYDPNTMGDISHVVQRIGIEQQ